MNTMMLNSWYRSFLEFIELAIAVVRVSMTTRLRYKDLIAQTYFMANQSAPIVIFCVCFAAIVTIIESTYHMQLVVHDVSMVPGFAALFVLRELGVVITALLVTSRVGAGIAAEVGSMKVTEQIEAFRMLGIDPIQLVVVPRILACVLACAVLSIIANAVCLIGTAIVSGYMIGFSVGEFVSAMRRFVDVSDLLFASLKGAVFGLVIPLIACFYGLRCQSGAEGVGLATTNSVVTASVAIIFLDFLLSYLLSRFY